MNFDTWKKLPPVNELAIKLGYHVALGLQRCESWDDYRDRFCAVNNQTDGGMVHAARKLFGGLSTGERPVLAAMLHAADFSWLADELSGQETWSRLDRTYGNHAAAVALAIMRQ